MLCNQFSIFIVFLKLHAGQVTRKKFRLIAIEKDLQFLEEEGFPLPETISLDQWEQLMLLENTFARNKYFDVMLTENNLEPLKDEQFEKILEDDKSRIGPLRLDQEVRQLWLFEILLKIPFFLKFILKSIPSISKFFLRDVFVVSISPALYYRLVFWTFAQKLKVKKTKTQAQKTQNSRIFCPKLKIPAIFSETQEGF